MLLALRAGCWNGCRGWWWCRDKGKPRENAEATQNGKLHKGQWPANRTSQFLLSTIETPYVSSPCLPCRPCHNHERPHARSPRGLYQVTHFPHPPEGQHGIFKAANITRVPIVLASSSNSRLSANFNPYGTTLPSIQTPAALLQLAAARQPDFPLS